ncbi:MAG: alpha/beta fold hydrolase [Desulfobacterales bacterium]|jgi:pimeloyl-ACP methyl ester carboxylesterase|nr:alpha/beta fold hydrolase [Desulfobacterales bacterium]
MSPSSYQFDLSKFASLYPFNSNYLDINGLKYHYLDQGHGEPVIMLHGNPTWSFYYRLVINALSPNYRCIVPDHIGCGLSEKPDEKTYDYSLKSRINDLEHLIRHLNLDKKITLVLHDWGGMIGLVFALQHIGQIGRIIIMNTSGFLPPFGEKIPIRLRIVKNFKLLSKILVQGFNLFSFSALYMASKKGLSKDVRKGLTAPYNSWENRIATLKFVHDIPLDETHKSYDLVNHVDQNLHRLSGIPLIFCWGEHDFVFDKTYLDEWKRRFPDAEFHTLPDAGHYALEDSPEVIIPLIKDFLKRYPL